MCAQGRYHEFMLYVCNLQKKTSFNQKMFLRGGERKTFQSFWRRKMFFCSYKISSQKKEKENGRCCHVQRKTNARQRYTQKSRQQSSQTKQTERYVFQIIRKFIAAQGHLYRICTLLSLSIFKRMLNWCQLMQFFPLASVLYCREIYKRQGNITASCAKPIEEHPRPTHTLLKHSQKIIIG